MSEVQEELTQFALFVVQNMSKNALLFIDGDL